MIKKRECASISEYLQTEREVYCQVHEEMIEAEIEVREACDTSPSSMT